MSESNIIPLTDSPPDVERVDLPSGGWVDVRTTAGYGAVRLRRTIGSTIGAKMAQDRLRQGITEEELKQLKPEDVAGDMSPEAMIQISEASSYFPVVYLVKAWSYSFPLPAIHDLSSLDEISIEDGEFLYAECERRYKALTVVEVTPDDKDDPESPTGSSSASARRSEANPSGAGSTPTGTSSDSSK